MKPLNLSYKDAGVDMEAGDQLVDRIKPLAKRTLRPEVLTGIGGFGALMGIPKRYVDPVLVSGTDGVGTKLKLAFELNQHNTVGIDLVAMSVNDILVQGAEPLFFLDYFACGNLNVSVAEAVIGGIAEGCHQSGCALIGGETAEMPDMYPSGEYDLAGFAVGVVEKEHLIDGRSITPGDVILGLASSGLHSNGFSLVRKILSSLNINPLNQEIKYDNKQISLSHALMAPTRIYVRSILPLLGEKRIIKGLAHITGGGLVGNIPRILPSDAKAVINKSAWEMPIIFKWLQSSGGIDSTEMYRVFNCGIGMVLIVDSRHAKNIFAQLQEAGEEVIEIGAIVHRTEGEQAIMINA